MSPAKILGLNEEHDVALRPLLREGVDEKKLVEYVTPWSDGLVSRCVC
jgi:hypothetical protein